MEKVSNKEFSEIISQFVDESDVLASKALAKVSAKITKKRSELQLNQTEFAEYMGVSQAMVSKWESGDYNFTVHTIAEICTKLDYNFMIEIENKGSTYKKDCGFKINGHDYNEPQYFQPKIA